VKDRLKADVFVLGGGPSGVCAALGAARCGAKVLLAERHFVLGGTATEALVNPWQTFHSRSGRAIGGIAQELVCRLRARGGCPGHMHDPIGFAASVTPFDYDVLKTELVDWTREEKIDVLFGFNMKGVDAAGGRIRSVVVEDEQRNVVSVEASRYIDATGNGDLSHAAGCRMEIDPDCQPMSLMFVLDGVDNAAVVDYQKKNQDEFYLGAGTSVLDRGYPGASGFFGHVRRARAAGRLEVPRDRVLFFGAAAPGQVVVNATRVTGFSGLYGDQISEAMKIALRQVWNFYGFMRDELPGFARSRIVRIADRIGVRETRRLVGRCVVNERDLLANAYFDDAVAKGAYPLDMHSPADESIATEMIGGKGYYDIPLRSLLSVEVENLLTVGKCISVTHRGFSSTRVMPTCMAVGHGGGVAAALAARGGKDPEDIAGAIRDELRRQKAIVLDEDVVEEEI
jgi:hypothetical protein